MIAELRRSDGIIRLNVFKNLGGANMSAADIPESLRWQPALEGWIPSALTTANLDDAAARLTILDQRMLPHTVEHIDCFTSKQVCDCIADLAVRGAPAIGIAGAFATVLWAKNEWPVIREAKRQVNPKSDVDSATVFARKLARRVEEIAATRPTAVNLAWACNQLSAYAKKASLQGASADQITEMLESLAITIAEDDARACKRIGERGAAILASLAADKGRPLRIETHCNAGALATSAWGTATSVIYHAFEAGDIEKVWVDETRPVEQGSRLTTWELGRAGVPYTLICDNMAGSIMRAGLVDAVIVGADRICANRDVANKIGTYSLAVLAHHHRIPFFVAAPQSTFDRSLSNGGEIVIEERDEREVRGMPYGHQWLPLAPANSEVYNPAFDVTPHDLISGIITETGILTETGIEFAE